MQELNREPVFEEIYKKRNARKMQERIGFTLKEDIASAQAEYLRNHGVVAEVGEGPKGNQTMEEFCSRCLPSERERKEEERRPVGHQG